MGSYCQRTPRRLHPVERVRTQSKITRGERLREGGRSQVGTRWSLLATWTSAVRTLWPSTEGGLLRSRSRSAGVPLRASQPDARSPTMYYLRSKTRGFCHGTRVATCCGADSD